MKKKDLSVFVGKRDKKRGRPSKVELMLSAMVSAKMEKDRPKIEKALKDALVMGRGFIEVSWP